MSRFFLLAAGAVAWGALLLVPQHQAAAQNTTDEQGAPTNYGATQEQGIQEGAPDEQGTQQRTNNEWNDRNERRESREARQGRDWRSEIRFGERTQDGLTISRVNEGSHYYRSGLRNGDVIISYNGQPLRNQEEFGRWANERSIERTPVIVLRDGRRETVYIQYENDRNQNDRNAERSYTNTVGQYAPQAFLGVRFEPRQRGAAVISAVVPGSPAEEAGLQPGDEIVSINGRRVGSSREVTRSVSSMQPGDKVDIEYSRPTPLHTQAVLKEHSGDVASARYQESDQNRQGATQYDGIEQSSYDQENATGATNEYRSNGQTTERRGGGLFQRRRN